MENVTFEKLNLTPRVKGIFKLNGIIIEDILADKYSLYDFYRFPHLGRKSMNDIKKAFLSIGYEFKDGNKYFDFVPCVLRPEVLYCAYGKN